MKKILFLVVSCMMTTFVKAQSTCETRVDAHQQATTKQRVAYCLNPDTGVPDNAYAGLVFSGVSAHYPQSVAVKQEPLTTKPGSFKPEKVSLERDYMETMQFPQVMQSTDQPVVAGQKEGYYTSLQGAAYTPVISNEFVDANMQEFVYVSSPTVPAKYPSSVQPSAEQTMIATQAQDVAQPIPTETKAGVKARQTKPERQWMATSSSPQESAPVTQSYAPATVGGNDGYEEIPLETTQSYAPATGDVNDGYEEIPVGTQSYAPATSVEEGV